MRPHVNLQSLKPCGDQEQQKKTGPWSWWDQGFRRQLAWMCKSWPFYYYFVLLCFLFFFFFFCFFYYLFFKITMPQDGVRSVTQLSSITYRHQSFLHSQQLDNVTAAGYSHAKHYDLDVRHCVSTWALVTTCVKNKRKVHARAVLYPYQ